MDPQSLKLLTFLGVFFLVILAALWFLLPFAVFGIKEKLNEIIKETRVTNEKLEKLRAAISPPSESEGGDQ